MKKWYPIVDIYTTHEINEAGCSLEQIYVECRKDDFGRFVVPLKLEIMCNTDLLPIRDKFIPGFAHVSSDQSEADKIENPKILSVRSAVDHFFAVAQQKESIWDKLKSIYRAN